MIGLDCNIVVQLAIRSFNGICGMFYVETLRT
jgi:hypothetical protein